MDHKTRYQALKEKGICVYCKTAPAEDGKTTCRICREKQRLQTAEKRRALKKMGFCPECGSNRIYGDETICPECAAKKYADNRKRRLGKTEEEKAKERENAKEKRLQLIEKGICVKCRKRKAEKNKTRCQICNIQERNRARSYRGCIARSERPAYGMCYFCGESIDTGSICEKCKQRVSKNLPETNPNEYWRMADNARIIQITGRKEKRASGSDFNV